MRRDLTLTTALFALALAIPASAGHCTTYSNAETEVDTNPLGIDGVPRYYVDNDPCGPDTCMFSLWVYEESNGIPGLQRGDEVRDGTCHGLVEADTIVV